MLIPVAHNPPVRLDNVGASLDVELNDVHDDVCGRALVVDLQEVLKRGNHDRAVRLVHAEDAAPEARLGVDTCDPLHDDIGHKLAKQLQEVPHGVEGPRYVVDLPRYPPLLEGHLEGKLLHLGHVLVELQQRHAQPVPYKPRQGRGADREEAHEDQIVAEVGVDARLRTLERLPHLPVVTVVYDEPQRKQPVHTHALVRLDVPPHRHRVQVPILDDAPQGPQVDSDLLPILHLLEP
mmetsp:Transcript_36699/g.89214  ORF Transcript_36699/g.89214 Transcript_36699/m.89214 type:complete len:236 (+) Transcript_36699:178-885(+)